MVTGPNTDFQSITLLAESFLESLSRFSGQSMGSRAFAHERRIHSRWPKEALRNLPFPAHIAAHPCSVFCDFQARGYQGDKRPLAMEGSTAPMMYPLCVLSVPSRFLGE